MTDSKEQAAFVHRFWKAGFETRHTSAPIALLARGLVAVYLLVAGWLAAGLARLRPPRTKGAGRDLSVLTIGPFYSSNWVAAQLEPLAQARSIDKVLVITPTRYRYIKHIEYVTPPVWLRRLVGMPFARALQALATAWRLRPDLVIGYHLPWNGIVALLVGRVIGARTAYFSVGGPAEIVGGGLYSEHALFSRQGRENQRAERGLLRLVSRFDDVLTMGSDGERYLREHQIEVPIWPVSVGVSEDRFRTSAGVTGRNEKIYDLITVCRLAKIKRVDLFLEIVARVARHHGGLRAVIVGEGGERAALEATITRLGISKHVSLEGWQEHVTPLLRQSRLFMMTSASEGLPLSLIEAMTCGLPAVVPKLGDLPDLVVDGTNGYLVAPGDVEAAARVVTELLADESRLGTLGRAAREAARHYSVTSCASRWDEFLANARD